MKAKTSFCIKDPKDNFLLYSVRKTKKESIQSHIANPEFWGLYENKGYRCVKVQITEVKPK